MNIGRAFAIVSLIMLAGCAGQGGVVPAASTGPARSTGLPFPGNDAELETPNSLPPGFTTRNPMAPQTGVVGVTHMGP